MSAPSWQRWTLGAVLGAGAILLLGLLALAGEPPAGASAAAAPSTASAAASSTGAPATETSTAEPAVEAAPVTPAGGRLGQLTPKAGMRGWELFFSKGCIECHALWGRGGTIGPDLGRARLGQLSEGELASQMWNSIPRMWAQIEAEQIHYRSIGAEEMRDLFAFFFFLRYMDRPGDPRRGRLAMLQHRCQGCHQVAGEGGGVGPDLARWAQYTNPVVWSQMMWKAAPEMQKQMSKKGLEWPEFAPGEITDMIAYVRSASPAREKVTLRLGSPASGAELLQTKKCTSCHGEAGDKAPDLGEADLPPNPAEAAAAMLNHAPAMLKEMGAAGLDPVALEAQQMADIVAYLLAATYLDEPGDPTKGAKVFESKGCGDCHEKGTMAAPELANMHPQGSAAYLAYVMWNKGPKMYREMTEGGTPWPLLSRAELLDLLAFFRQRH